MISNNVTTVSFGPLRKVIAHPLWQYDYGQILKIEGLALPQVYEVHFSLTETGGTSIEQIGDADGVIIPDALLLAGTPIYAFIFLHTGTDDGETEYKIIIPVRARPKPSEEKPTPVQQDVITQTIAALNAGVEAAEEAQEAAETAQQAWENMSATAETLPEGSAATASYASGVLSIGVPAGATGAQGAPGKDGVDGFSPSASVSKSGNTATISITDKDGPTSAQISDGKDGATGATPVISIGTVSKLSPGSNPTASMDTTDPEHPVLSLGLVTGDTGEVTQAEFDALQIAKADIITDTASGTIASFPDGADGMPVEHLSVAVEPVQDLHGYENPWPAGGGKNLFDASTYPTTTKSDVTCTNNGDGSFTLNGTASADCFFDVFAPQFLESQGGTPLPNGAYRITGCPTGGSASTYYMYITPSYTGDFGNGNTNNDTTISGGSIFIKNGYTCNNLVFRPMIRTASNGDDTFAPYSNICPISGFDSVNVSRTGKNIINPSELVYSAGGNNVWYGTQLPPDTDFVFSTDSTITGLYVAYSDADEMPSISGTEWASITYKYNTTSLGFNSGSHKWYRLMTYEINGVIRDRLYQLELGSTASDYESYQGETYDIAFPSEAGTVYGGSLSIAEDGSGVLTVDRAMKDLGTMNWYADPNRPGVFYTSSVSGEAKRRGEVIADIYSCRMSGVPSASNLASANNSISLYESYGGRYIYTIDIAKSSLTANEYKTAVSGINTVYQLSTPQTYTLTASEIRTLLGQNNFWHDANGDISVGYKANTKLYIDQKITEAIAAAMA